MRFFELDSQMSFYVLFTSVHLLWCPVSHSVMDKKKENKRDKRSSFCMEESKYKSVHYNVFDYLYKIGLNKRMRRFIAKRSRGYSRTIGFNCILQAGGFSLWKISPSLGKPSLKWIENSIQLRTHVTGNWKLSLAFHTKGWPISVTEHKQSCLWKGICWSRCFFPARIYQTSLRTGNKNLSLLTVLRVLHLPLSTIWSLLHLPSRMLHKNSWTIHRISLSSHPQGNNP